MGCCVVQVVSLFKVAVCRLGSGIEDATLDRKRQRRELNAGRVMGTAM